MVDDPYVYMLRQGGQKGLASDPGQLNTGLNGGYQAVGLAIAAGATRVVLIGYDMRYAKDGRSHWHAGHPVRVSGEYYSNVYTLMFASMNPPASVRVVNATPDSALTCFERGDLARLLPDP